ncbi:MAG: methylated-DNA--[protein]-cysteine S-methyltransferase [candidate division Zixibacteria bacterium]|nr:methylated-DNA--[protein]-cysteine S-methyltransferase [candidate division Zixibacteria bacterium]
MSNDSIICRDLESPLGDMIAGTTNYGVCFLEWHDRGGVPHIKARVEKRYRAQLIEGHHDHLDLLERELEQYFEGTLHSFTVPIFLKGTAFERLTWDHLLSIPYGSTLAYGEMAAQLGKPGAARAVGRANGANYLSIVVPCHRVIEAGGGLRGYGGGLWRKERLLDLEAGRKMLWGESAVR